MISSFFLFAAEERSKVMAELGNFRWGRWGRRWAGGGQEVFPAVDRDKKVKYETIQAEA